jgi:UDP-glucuronate 4-epimerase
MPFSVHDNVDHPVSLYAASKKANELMAHTYSHLYGLACTGLRFFTVYGPWGRPDMALFLFTDAILKGRPIQVFNHGRMQRDFTYIDDIVEGVVRVMGRLPAPNPAWSGDRPDPGTSYAPYKIYNIGNNQPVELNTFIATIESVLGRTARKEFLDIQPGDVPATYADVDDLMADVSFTQPPHRRIERFVAWYRSMRPGMRRPGFGFELCLRPRWATAAGCLQLTAGPIFYSSGRPSEFPFRPTLDVVS